MASLDQVRDAIMTVESGGKNHGPNRVGASGYFQIIPGTWANFGGYSQAYQAPYEVQKARANQLMGNYYNSGGGRWEFVAIAWFGGPAAAAKWAKGQLNMGGNDGAVSFQGYISRVGQALGTGSSATVGGGAPSLEVDVTGEERAYDMKEPTVGDIAGEVAGMFQKATSGSQQGGVGTGGTGEGVGLGEGVGVENVGAGIGGSSG